MGISTLFLFSVCLLLVKGRELYPGQHILQDSHDENSFKATDDEGQWTNYVSISNSDEQNHYEADLNSDSEPEVDASIRDPIQWEMNPNKPSTTKGNNVEMCPSQISFQNVGDTKWLDVDQGTAEGKQVITWPWNGGTNQKWIIESSSGVTGTTIVPVSQNVGPIKILNEDAYNYKVRVTIFDMANPHQIWSILRVAVTTKERIYRIVSQGSQRCLSSSKQSSRKVGLKTEKCEAKDSKQLWRITGLPDEFKKRPVPTTPEPEIPRDEEIEGGFLNSTCHNPQDCYILDEFSSISELKLTCWYDVNKCKCQNTANSDHHLLWRDGKCRMSKYGPCGIRGTLEVACLDGFVCIENQCLDPTQRNQIKSVPHAFEQSCSIPCQFSDELELSCNRRIGKCLCQQVYVADMDSPLWDIRNYDGNRNCSVGEHGPCGKKNGISIECHEDATQCVGDRCVKLETTMPAQDQSIEIYFQVK